MEKLKFKENEVATLKQHMQLICSERDDLKKDAELLVAVNNQSLHRLGAITEERPEASKIDELLKRILKSDQLIDALAVERTENAELIRHVHAENGICRNTIQLLKEDIKEKEKALEAKQKALEAKEMVIETKDASLKTKDKDLVTFTKQSQLTIKAKDEIVKELEKKIQELIGRLLIEIKKSSALESSIKDKDKTIQNYKTKSTEQAQLIEQLNNDINQRRNRIKELTLLKMEHYEKLDENEATIEQLWAELQYMKNNTFKKKCKKLFSCRSSRSQPAERERPVARQQDGALRHVEDTEASSSRQAPLMDAKLNDIGSTNASKSPKAVDKNPDSATSNCGSIECENSGKTGASADKASNVTTGVPAINSNAGDVVTPEQDKDVVTSVSTNKCIYIIPEIIITPPSTPSGENVTIAQGPTVAPKPKIVIVTETGANNLDITPQDNDASAQKSLGSQAVAQKPDDVMSVHSAQKIDIVDSQALAPKPEGPLSTHPQKISVAESQVMAIKPEGVLNTRYAQKIDAVDSQAVAKKPEGVLNVHVDVTESQAVGSTEECILEGPSVGKYDVAESQEVIPTSDVVPSILSINEATLAKGPQKVKKPNLTFSVTTIVSCTSTAMETDSTTNNEAAASINEHDSTQHATNEQNEVAGRQPNLAQ
ncbi:uncharacterized protein [Clytia hemisphaerica]|uniref:uncharacterized protein n=1 Tax=Clytia hemisphaerica TaxID=252671 RepID=UPI0034D5948A